MVRAKGRHPKVTVVSTKHLGGGNSNMFYFHPENLGKMNPNLTCIFFNWVGCNHQLDQIFFRRLKSPPTTLPETKNIAPEFFGHPESQTIHLTRCELLVFFGVKNVTCHLCSWGLSYPSQLQRCGVSFRNCVPYLPYLLMWVQMLMLMRLPKTPKKIWVLLIRARNWWSSMMVNQSL